MRRFAYMLPRSHGSPHTNVHPEERAMALIKDVDGRVATLSHRVAKQQLATALLEVKVRLQELKEAQRDKVRLQGLANDARSEAQLLLAKLQSAPADSAIPTISSSARVPQTQTPAPTNGITTPHALRKNDPTTNIAAALDNSTAGALRTVPPPLPAELESDAQAFIRNLAHSKLLPDSGPHVTHLKAMLGRALQKLGEDLYSSETHFLNELIQNADDNAFAEDVVAEARFELHSRGA